MKILVTGAAGFIGSYVCKRLLSRGDEVVGLDNINSYYDVNLKYGRLGTLGIDKNTVDWYKFVQSNTSEQFRFVRINLEDKQAMRMLFANESFDKVVNLAAQAGVRYSIENPYAYVESNIDGFLNVLEGCRHYKVKHLVYASSSSVYGLNGKVPFSEKDSIAHPVSLYAATKKSNELMAHTYSHLYGIPSTGLRFFTVYGPWGRPDMSPFLFADAMLHGRPIKVFNNGDMLRDFTYIDDIVEGVWRVMQRAPEKKNGEDGLPIPAYKVYNIGNNSPENLLDFVSILQEELIRAKVLPQNYDLRPGDVSVTYADTTPLEQDFGFKPSTSLRDGLRAFAEWYSTYYICVDK